MKLHNPFRVSVATDNFLLFVCTCIVVISTVILAAFFIEQHLTAKQLVSIVAMGMLPRVIYAVFKGK